MKSYVAAFLDRHAHHAAEVAVIAADRATRTFAEVDRDRQLLASAFMFHGVGVNSQVLLAADPGYRWLVALLAIQSCGAHAWLAPPTGPAVARDVRLVVAGQATTAASVFLCDGAASMGPCWSELIERGRQRFAHNDKDIHERSLRLGPRDPVQWFDDAGNWQALAHATLADATASEQTLPSALGPALIHTAGWLQSDRTLSVVHFDGLC